MPPVVHTFGGYRLDPTRRNLTSPDGAAVKLTGKAFDTLAYLVEHSGQVVDRTTLIQALWPRRVVEDNNLNQAIAAIRRAIGDEHIVTVAGRGYQLVTAVSSHTSVNAEEQRPDAPRDEGRLAGAAPSAPNDASQLTGHVPSASAGTPAKRLPRRLIAIAAVSAVATVLGVLGFLALSERRPADVVIAVLPCENLSPDPDRGFFASGIQEALIDQLAALGFGVIGRAAVMPYAGGTEPLTAVARALNADAVMECSVRYADDRVRIAVALLDGTSGSTLWRRPYEGEFANYFAIESEIASSVARALGATIEPDRRAAVDNIASHSARAIEFYFSARRYEELGVTSWPTAAAQYERAVAEDAGFARAFAQLAMVRIGMYISVAPVRENLDKARAAAEEALRLDPDLPHGRVAMLTYELRSGTKTAAAIAEELVALERDARGVSEFFVLRGVVSQRLGRREDALADITKAVELGQPRDVPLLVVQALAHQQLRQYEKTAQLFDRIADIAPDDWGTKCHRAVLSLVSAGDTRAARATLQDVPPTAPTCGALVTAALMDGDYDTALRLSEKNLIPPDDPRRQAQTGIILRHAGRADEARPLLESARSAFTLQLANTPPEGQPGLKLTLARLSAYLGEAEVARRHTDEALADMNDAPPGSVPDLRLTAAAVYAITGNTELAIAELDRYLAGAGEWSIDGIARSPDFQLLREDARFSALREKYRPSIVAARAAN